MNERITPELAVEICKRNGVTDFALLPVATAMCRLEQRIAELEALVRDFVDSDPCHYDHHGYCQAHGWFETTPACPHARAKALQLT